MSQMTSSRIQRDFIEVILTRPPPPPLVPQAAHRVRLSWAQHLLAAVVCHDGGGHPAGGPQRHLPPDTHHPKHTVSWGAGCLGAWGGGWGGGMRVWGLGCK